MPEIMRQWHSLHDQIFFEVSVTATPGSETQAQARAAIEVALKEIHIAGFDPGHIMRSRLWCRDANSRRAASDVRRDMLTGDLRAASASFIDADGLPPGADVRASLLACSANRQGSRKSVREYEPAITPPMFAALGELVFLSGNTDESPHFHTQVAQIRGKIDASLAAAGASLRDAIAFDAHVARRIDMAAAIERIHAQFAEAPCALTLHSVDGFSAPAKLLEIEITALRSSQ